jgi:hypothetical protein
MMTEMRRVRTEVAKQSYEQNGNTEYQFLALGGSPCNDCADLDGRVFPVKEMMPGTNAPPMHPRCLCSTAPYWDEAKFQEWLDGPAQNGVTWEDFENGLNGTASIFNSGSSDGESKAEFDIQKEREEYAKWAETLKEPYDRILKFYNEQTDYEKAEKMKRAPFGYSRTNDIIYYNPTHPDFDAYDFRIVNTHELAHRYDELVQTPSRIDPAYDVALTAAQDYVKKNKKAIHTHLSEHEISDNFSDILSAIGVDQRKLTAGHPDEYWAIEGNRNGEVFANTFSLAAFEYEDLKTFQKWFPELWEVYNRKIQAEV